MHEGNKKVSNHLVSAPCYYSHNGAQCSSKRCPNYRYSVTQILCATRGFNLSSVSQSLRSKCKRVRQKIGQYVHHVLSTSSTILLPYRRHAPPIIDSIASSSWPHTYANHNLKQHGCDHDTDTLSLLAHKRLLYHRAMLWPRFALSYSAIIGPQAAKQSRLVFGAGRRR